MYSSFEVKVINEKTYKIDLRRSVKVLSITNTDIAICNGIGMHEYVRHIRYYEICRLMVYSLIVIVYGEF